MTYIDLFLCGLLIVAALGTVQSAVYLDRRSDYD